MDFFQHQEIARRRTTTLVVYYILALLVLIVAFYALIVLLVVLLNGNTERPSPNSYAVRLEQNAFFDPLLLLGTSAGVILLVGGASCLKTIELSAGGGDAVAEQMGGRLISGSPGNARERRLLNIVEEMSIASGINIPNVYVLDQEDRINAFAAGLTPNTAAIGITRGSLEYLDRDELQGVVAHEFSHILNGDMRINLRLIGILFGLNLLVILGWFALRMTMYSNLGGGRSNDRDKSGAAILVVCLVLGLGCLVLGSIGMIFSSLIQAAISRQREYLADASAVQFTRNPAGIAGALKKIGCPNVSSRITNAHAVEASHMFIANVFGIGSFSNLMATHPPLADRIKRIDPSFNGRFPEEIRPVAATTEEPAKKTAPSAAGSVLPGNPFPINPAQAMGRFGQIDFGQLAVAAALLESIPPTVQTALAQPFGARAVLYAMLLSDQDEVRRRQLTALSANLEKPCFDLTTALAGTLKHFPASSRVSLVQKALPPLRTLSLQQYTLFRKNVETLVAADGQIDLFEYTLRGLLLNDLDIHFGLIKPLSVQYSNLNALTEPFVLVLSFLAYAGNDDPAEIRKAFEAGRTDAGIDGSLLPPTSCTFAGFDTSLKKLAVSTPAIKKQLLSAALCCIAADGTITPREGELVRAIAATLGCPMPPFGG